MWIDQQDREAIQRIRQRWGLGTDSDAIRLAIRVLSVSRLEVLPEIATRTDAAGPEADRAELDGPNPPQPT